MAEDWTPQDEAIYAPLRRKKLRVDARKRKDKTGRTKRYGARTRKPLSKKLLKDMAMCYEDGNCKNTSNLEKCNNCQRNWSYWPDLSDNFEPIDNPVSS